MSVSLPNHTKTLRRWLPLACTVCHRCLPPMCIRLLHAYTITKTKQPSIVSAHRQTNVKSTVNLEINVSNITHSTALKPYASSKGTIPTLKIDVLPGHLPELRWSPSPPEQRSALSGAPKAPWPAGGEAGGGVQATSAQQMSPSRRGQVPPLIVRAFILFADGRTRNDVRPWSCSQGLRETIG